MENIRERLPKSYTEVVTYLSLLSLEELSKIPNEKIELYTKYMDNSYNYKIDFTKPIKEQQMMEETKAILANLFRDYFANDYQKQRIISNEKYDMEKIKEVKTEKYNPYQKLEERNKKIENHISASTKEIVVYKENFFKKIINKIRNIFKQSK